MTNARHPPGLLLLPVSPLRAAPPLRAAGVLCGGDPVSGVASKIAEAGLRIGSSNWSGVRRGRGGLRGDEQLPQPVALLGRKPVSVTRLPGRFGPEGEGNRAPIPLPGFRVL